mgnify:CR=1 FL=1
MINNEKIKKEGLRSMKEFEMAWEEFFKNKLKPKNDEEDRKQQEDFYLWYNYARKQSDTGKTPAEMYKEVYGEEPKNILDEKKPSRFMNFEWDEDYNEEDFDDENFEEEKLKEITEFADQMFENGAWQNSKEQMKDMSKRDSSRHMFRLGVFMHSQYMNEQMKTLAKEIGNMPKEEVQKIIDSFEKEEENKENKWQH